MKLPMQEVTKKQLMDSKHRGYRLIGYKEAYCDLINSCEECDRAICFLCRVIRKIEEIQTRRILKICK